MPTPLKERIAAALADFASAPDAVARPDLFVVGLHLFEALGYDTSRQARLPDNSAKGFIADFVTATDTFSPDRARTAEWRTVELLFQLTQAEVINQVSLFDTRQVDRSRIETYLFWAIELTGDGYTRAELAGITREVNRLFPMPCFVVFRYGGCITLATIDRRLHKRDEGKDVLGKITLIKSIDLREPHPGHIAILHDLSFGELYQRYRFDSFVGLHQAWLKTLDVALLNRRFYRELYSWYEWAAQPESGVVFPRPASDATGPNALSEDAYRRLSLIRLLTRVIFVWFLREKKLVPTDLFLPATLKKHLKGFDPLAEASSSFYQGILQNLFFATLNTPMRRDVEARLAAGDTDAAAELRRFARDGDRDAHTDQTQYRGEELFTNPTAALELFKDVPFLNGGLFECLDSRDPDGAGEQRYDGFSTKPKKRATVPNALFFGEKSNLDQSQAFGGDKKQRQVTAHGLVVILERYKFTVAENTPLEEEVALDPELLGKVFENLLATYNPETQTTARKLTGSFYTPREIVDYMVDESLRAYLAQALPAPAGSTAAERLAQLFAPEDPAAEDPNPFGADSADTLALIAALSRCRVLDPACGSGAFPMGVLHRMVALLRRLDPDNIHFQAEQLRLADDDIARAEAISAAEVREPAVRNAEQRRATVVASFQKDAEAARAALPGRRGPLVDGLRRQNYARKLFLIENCIYGVDIQQIAVQIAKLRFFISLLAEQRVDDSEENRNILAMPNLETKFVAANTLVPLDRSNTLGTHHPLVVQREQELQQLRQQLFFVRKYPEKKRLRQREQTKRHELSQALETAGFSRTAADQVAAWSPLDVMHPAGFFDAETMFGLTDGFDVVIGNPPYSSKQSVAMKTFAKFYKHVEYKLDPYALFIENSTYLASKSGVVVFITPLTWLSNHYYFKLRKYLVDSKLLSNVVKLNFAVFESANVDTAILTLQRDKSRDSFSILEAEKDTLSGKLKWSRYDTVAKSNRYEIVLSEEFGKIRVLIENETTELADLRKISLGMKLRANDEFVFPEKGPSNPDTIIFGSDIQFFTPLKPASFFSYRNSVIIGGTKKAEVYHANPKILIQSIRNLSLKRRIVATIDDSGYYFIGTVNGLTPIPGVKVRLNDYYLLALINSSVLNYYFAERFTTISLTAASLGQLPIKEISEPAQLPFIRLVEYILWLKGQNPADSRAQYFERVLDGLVYELYFPQALQAGGCEVGRHLPPLPALPAAPAAAEAQLQTLYTALEAKDHPVRKSLTYMGTVEEVAIVEGKKK